MSVTTITFIFLLENLAALIFLMAGSGCRSRWRARLQVQGPGGTPRGAGGGENYSFVGRLELLRE